MEVMVTYHGSGWAAVSSDYRFLFLVYVGWLYDTAWDSGPHRHHIFY